jgi:hypothetical protein
MKTSLRTSHIWPARVVVALLVAASLMVARHAPVLAASCVVTSTADSGAGTLRQCLSTAAQGDTITFDPTVFPPGAPATIALTDPLPVMTVGGVTIDATNAGVKLNGDGIDEANADGLVLASSNNAIYGLHLHAFHGRGILVQPGADNNQIGGALPGQRNIIEQSGNGAIHIQGNSNQVSGNWLGTEDGLTLPGVAGNAGNGIELTAGAQQNIIGGAQPGQGNVIVGSMEFGVVIQQASTMSNTVAGNYIGLNATGTAALGNAWAGVLLVNGATANVIGGDAGSGAQNYIAGNAGHGVIISGVGTDSNQLLGNYIGTDVNGAVGFGNAGHGVLVEGGAQGTVIGSGAATRNLISANRDAGIRIESAGTDHTIVRGNYIGVDATGTAALGNGDVGVDVREAATRAQIGGSGAGEGNVISGNGFDGIRLFNSGVASNTIAGNYIGLDATGTASLPNAGNGIWIGGGAAANVVGGAVEGARNVISGNDGTGVTLENTNDNRVSNNYIGLDATGLLALGNNGRGIAVRAASTRNLIGGYSPVERNVIGANADAGISLSDSGVTSNTIAGNYIGLNAAGTANLGNDYTGVSIGDGATANVIGGDADQGARNYISGNKEDGVTIRGSATAFNVVSGNSIGLDVDGTRSIYIQALVLAPGFPAPPWLWAGTQNSGVWKSADGGAHWAAANTGLTQLDVRALAVAPSGELFAGSADGVFKSTDGGANWVEVSPAGDFAVVALVVSPNYAADHTVVAAAEEYLQVSTDGGATWQRYTLAPDPGWIMTLAISPAFAADRTLFAGTDASEIFKSVDGGATWTPLAGTWADQGRITALGVSPAYATDQTIFAGIFWGGVDIGLIYRSADGGGSWAETAGQPAQVMRAFGFSPTFGAGDPTLFVGDASRGVFRSTDGGASWQNTLTALDGTTIAVSPNFGADGTVFVGSDPVGVFRSQDRGAQWVAYGDLTEQGNAGSGVVLAGGAHDNVIGGATAGERNLISHNGDAGVEILDSGTTANRVVGNYIGVSSDGLSAVGNGDSGVKIRMDASGNMVGGSTADERNIISGNRSDGVWIRGGGVNSNTVTGNYIGVDVTGMHALGNKAQGIFVGNGAAFNQIGGRAPGQRNVISGNGKAGVQIESGHQNLVQGNYVGVNANGSGAVPNAWNGIALGDGAQGNQIGGATAGEGNLISGNSNYGVALYDEGTLYNVVLGNRIGTDATGNLAVPNQESGVELRGGPAMNTIGGLNPTVGSGCTGACNLISGNGSSGVLLIDQETMSNTVSGNYIGTNLSGSVALPNADGVRLEYGASHNMIGGAAAGVGNLIAHNTAVGVLVNDATTLANTIAHNRIYSNTQTGIDLSNGGNAELVAPVIITVTNGGMVVGTACANCTVEAFSDAAGQGRVFEGSAVANGAGQFTFQATRLLTGPQLTTTATDASGNTSEFSPPFAMPAQTAHVYLPMIKK